jgi:2-keto-4-pentenoate hydratase
MNAIERAAERLRKAQRHNTPCPPVRDLIAATDIESAYAVQRHNAAHWTAQGRRPVGRKIALASRTVQQQMGIDQPTHGVLFADMCLPEGADIDCATLIQAKIETEVAVILERPLPHAHHTLADLIGAIAYIVPAFEIVGCRIAGWDVSAADFIADNSAGSRLILGSRPRRLSDFDIVRCKMLTECHGETVSSGSGAASLGNPLNALAWLADNLANAGQPLQAGDIIMTGSLGPMATISPGDTFNAEIEGLGKISANFY